jgi:hypothetical protein
MRSLILAATAAAVLSATGLMASPAVAHAKTTHDTCASRLCLTDKPGTKSCLRMKGHVAIARCYIVRAARHYHQSASLALYIAHRESKYRWWVTNSSAHRGMYQFDDTLWGSTPYARRHRSVYSPRFAALGAMRIWAHGGYSNWRCC